MTDTARPTPSHRTLHGTRLRPALITIVALLLAVASVAVAEAPDRLLLPGTPYETPVYELEADTPGPTVVVVGGVHGNEPAGAAAAERIRRWSIDAGRLVVVPRANVPALDAGRRRDPLVPRDDGDLNRCFPHEDRAEPVGRLAAALWELIVEAEPDWVVDLHEGYGFRAGGSKSVGNSLIYLASAELDPIAERMQAAVNATIEDPDRRFVLLRKSGGVKGGLTRASRERLGAHSFTIETVYTDQPLERRVGQQLLLVDELFQHIGLIEESRLTPADRTAPRREPAAVPGQ